MAYRMQSGGFLIIALDELRSHNVILAASYLRLGVVTQEQRWRRRGRAAAWYYSHHEARPRRASALDAYAGCIGPKARKISRWLARQVIEYRAVLASLRSVWALSQSVRDRYKGSGWSPYLLSLFAPRMLDRRLEVPAEDVYTLTWLTGSYSIEWDLRRLELCDWTA